MTYHQCQQTLSTVNKKEQFDKIITGPIGHFPLAYVNKLGRSKTQLCIEGYSESCKV